MTSSYDLYRRDIERVLDELDASARDAEVIDAMVELAAAHGLPYEKLDAAFEDAARVFAKLPACRRVSKAEFVRAALEHWHAKRQIQDT